MTKPQFRRKAAAKAELKSGQDAEERVFSLVVEAVQDQRLKAGDRLVERELAEAAGANRQAIRNGLLRLVNAGLVETSRNKGARIVRLSAAEAEQVFEARLVVETGLLQRLARTYTDEAGVRLQEILRAEGAAYDEGNVVEARHHSRLFHMEMGRLAGNRHLSRLLNDLINCQPLLMSHRRGRPSEFSGHNLHIKTLAALARGDSEGAVHYNNQLLSAVKSEMLLDIKASEDDDGPPSA
ncbi:transcriptional regulator [Mameliella alba]|uniref:GntR family transcriptional regulator n=1 Tax=Mameliella TaxID=1434019 RepID=UPI00088DC05F|nr:GntR family transcriptional regulator [Mameliella alba]MCR9274262.1 GntR family transcriptional regulator [Paracoccaceae bacterium]OWV41385.1 GntR family transcriptional regulator [Mameliella alba]OWV54486.1 GntR family transcriptional regulator [Mameliella alba]PTR38939.1 DNA-binding GntR family transcriptional regulator [Mameliella alba]SDD48426.1 DNA-binding transcriptional regulator, GntR family [Mameliella alba]